MLWFRKNKLRNPSRFFKRFCSAGSSDDDNKSIMERKNQDRSLVPPKKIDKVLATPVKFPFLPGIRSFIKFERPNAFEPREKWKKKKLAFFMKKTKNEKINSLDDIHTVGTYGHYKELNSFSFLNSPFPHSEKSLYNEMISIKTVKAISFDKGYVTIEEYGNPLIYNLSKNDMPQKMRDLFSAVQNKLHQLNESRINNGVDLPTFSSSKKLETIEHLRSYVGFLFPDCASKMQSILEIEEPMNVLEELLKLTISQSIKEEFMKETENRLTERIVKEQNKIFLEMQLELLNEKLKTEEPVKKNEGEINSKIPKDARTMIQKQQERLKMMSQYSHESDTIRAHLEWLQKYPWGEKSKDSLDLREARRILDEDHFALHKMKDRILEHIATGKLSNSLTKGKILCLVGPPGVGKTSVGKSIARALGREFVSLSLGGLSDPVEIKGHRRAYVGSQPGRIVNLICKAKKVNPLFMIDEIDKIGSSSYRGNVSATMLEILDSSQNNKFLDMYMDVEIDLSDVMFVCTANSTQPISAPLADRMEFIHLDGYIASEKLSIAKKHLVPKARKDCGLTEEQAKLSPESLMHIIRWYCREPGVRSLERSIQKVMRKVALGVVQEDFKEKAVEKSDIEKYLGVQRFTKDRIFDETPVGVAMGLSWTDMGGMALYVETCITGEKSKEGKQFTTTGQLGSVISESVTIAFTVTQKILERYQNKEAEGAAMKLPSPSPKSFLQENKVHIHFPEGAVKKDGPSAGVTLVCALVSLATKTPIKKNLSMTGEIMLSGQMLAVGGIKEKMLAAIAANVKEVILPDDCRSSWEELDEEIKEKLKARFVTHVDEAVKIAFPHLSFV